jgi:nucleotide-binding universal stress UspA family protein
VRVDPNRVLVAARTEVCRYMGRLCQIAEYLSKRAAMKGVETAVSYERTLFGDNVYVSVSFRLLRTSLDEKETLKYLVTRARALEKVLDFIKRELEEHGITCEVRSRVTTGPSPEVLVATMSAEFRVVDVDVNKILSKPFLRALVLGGSQTNVGMMRSADIKAVETETLIEYERGGEVVPAEEDLGAAAEGGGEEEPAAAGSHPVGPREAAERGYLRLSRAVLKYNVPLYVLVRLALDGRIETLQGVDENGVPALYVKEEDVKEVAKYIRLEEKEGEEGGGSGG